MTKEKKINIFIVDDNKIFSIALKAQIETSFIKKPIKVYSFETGEACMKKFKEEEPQLVILDYHLNSNIPDAADGIKVLDWIKKKNSETNVIMLTSDDHIDIAVKSFKHGASDYVVKTETQFKKINYSLLNLFKMIEAKVEARRYKYIITGLGIGFALFVAGIIVIHIFRPSLLILPN